MFASHAGQSQAGDGHDQVGSEAVVEGVLVPDLGFVDVVLNLVFIVEVGGGS